MKNIPSSEITPEPIYRSRRQFMVGIGALALGAAAAGCGLTGPAAPPVPTPAPDATKATADELGSALTSFESITNYNNFYEFSTDKEDVAGLAKDFKTAPWTLTVGGLVQQAQDLRRRGSRRTLPPGGARLPAALRRGLVDGHPLAGLPAAASCWRRSSRTASAQYVRFETLRDPEEHARPEQSLGTPGRTSRGCGWTRR